MTGLLTNELLDPAGAAAPGAAAPVLKWAGGKRWLVPMCGRAIRAYLGVTQGRYIEPFLGGGALALWLGSTAALLGDLERPLVGTYEALRADHEAVGRALARLVRRGVGKSDYLAVRAARPRGAVGAAARVLYLNRLAYNGLYRTNRAGRFNVPYGRYPRPSFPGREQLAAVAHALAPATLVTGDFERLVDQAGAGDVVFADPPYLGTFRHYAAGGGFAEADHERLAAALEGAAGRGAAVLTTNADDPRVRAWYAWAELVPTSEPRAVSCTALGRARARCLLATTHPQLIWTSAVGSVR